MRQKRFVETWLMFDLLWVYVWTVFKERRLLWKDETVKEERGVDVLRDVV